MRPRIAPRVSTLVVLVAVAACAAEEAPADDDAAASSGAGAATASSSVSTSSTASSVASSSSSGGTGGDGNDACARAITVDYGQEVDGELEQTGDGDYYAFAGKKGQALRIDALAEALDSTQLDPDHIDTVVTLYDGSGRQIAQNDSAVPADSLDASLLTLLPADDTYCVRVAECWSVAKNPADDCLLPKDKTHNAYRFRAIEMDPADDAFVANVELGGDAASATPLEYEKLNDGSYETGYAWGTFVDGSDVDVFAFTLPSDAPVASGHRLVANTWLLPSGPDFDGSTTPIGGAYITTAADPTTHLAELDGSVGSFMFVPLEPGVPHLLFVPRASGKVGTNDFYFLRYNPRDGNALETSEPGNDVVAGAEAMTEVLPYGQGGTVSYVDGDLTNTGADVDHFLFDVPAGTSKLVAKCGAASFGSGLVGLTASVMKTDGTPLANGSATEDKAGLAVASPALPAGETQLVLEVAAAGQSVTVRGTHYRCSVYLLP